MSDADQILALAIGVAGPAHDGFAAWADRLDDAVLEVTAVFGEGSRQRKAVERLREATIFTGNYLDYRVEHTSTRCIVRLDTGHKSDKNPTGIEEIRTDRTDSSEGRRMRSRLDQIPAGSKVCVWKAMETFSGDPNRKVRVLAHISYLGPSDNKTSAAAPEPASSPRAAPTTRGASGATSAAAEPMSSHDEVKAMLADLTGPQKVEVARRAKGAGIPNVMNPVGKVEDLMAIILDVAGAGERLTKGAT